MTNSHDPIDGRDSEHLHRSGDGLDAGLRAAFSAGATTMPGAVPPAVADVLPDYRSIVLRDVDDPLGELINPRAARDEPGVTGLRRYQVAGVVARGGVGVVLKARDCDIGRDVAIKVLRRDFAGHPEMLRRFVEEAQIAGQLQHPGVAPVYELAADGAGRPFIAMKLVQGRTLAALLAERPSVTHDRPRFLAILEQVGRTVAYAHAKGVIHRDLKPSNVMVGAFGEVQVVDWGLAKVLAAGGVADEVRSATIVETARSGSGVESVDGAVMGTPAYMPPEQAAGQGDRLDERSDVFSLGAILCEVLTGAPPYSGSPREALRAARDADLSAARAAVQSADADEELKTLALHCLAPGPTDRPRHAGLVADRLSAHLASLGERARASELALVRAQERARHERGARRLTLAVAALAVLLLVTGGGAWAWLTTQQRKALQADSARLDAAAQRTATALGAARFSPIGDDTAWAQARRAGVELRERLSAATAEQASQDRAVALLDELDAALLDRRTAERIEEAVILGATHEDRDSWLAMERELRGIFADRGIDLDRLTPEQVTERIRSSGAADRLVDGLELWLGTIGHLYGFGVQVRPMQELFAWLEVLYAADPDPFRTRLRRLLYSPTLSESQVGEFLAGARLEELTPRTIAWLGSLYYRVKDHDGGVEVLWRGSQLHPGDFMLNFDAGYHCVAAARWEDAIRYYMRCTAIRPDSAGVWRALGNALRESGDVDRALAAYDESLRRQADHPWTQIDRARALLKADRAPEAVALLEGLVGRHPGVAAAHARLAQALCAADRSADARAAWERGRELAPQDPFWNQPRPHDLRLECLESASTADDAQRQPASDGRP
ncbi:MAG: protein kinase [Phycisphaerales bacterium]|nr:protein kinase [Phycisphaerales bacterium]